MSNTQAEEVSWIAQLMYLAWAMMPNLPESDAFLHKAVQYSLCSVARPADHAVYEDYHGQPLALWIHDDRYTLGFNIFDNGMVYNKNMIAPGYAAAVAFQNLQGGLVAGRTSPPSSPMTMMWPIFMPH